MKTLKLILASLFKNDAALNGRHQKWWVAVILFFASVVLALVPSFTAVAGTSGDDIFNKTQYNFDVGLLKFTESIESNGIDLVVTSGELTNPTDNWISTYTDKVVVNGVDNHYFSYKDVEDKELFRVYYNGNISTNASRDLNAHLVGLTYDVAKPETKIVSFIILGKTNFYAYIYNPNTATNGNTYTASYGGLFIDVATGTNLRTFATQDLAGNAISRTGDYNAYRSAITESWSHLFSEGYQSVKQDLLWGTTGIYAAIYAVITLFMALIIFVLTRGKSNPYNFFKLTDSLKVASWTAFSPAVITLIIGFLFPAYAQMSFIMLVGIRVMWMSMKTFRPAVQ